MKKFVKSGKQIILLEYSLPKAKKVVILSHGFLSNKNNFFMRAISFALLFRGIGSVRFNYGAEDITDRVSILDDVINYVAKTASSIGLLGSSLGGMTSIIAAKNIHVKSLALVNTVYDQKETYENYLKNHKILSKILDYNVKKHFFNYDLKKIIKSLRIPTLIISSTKDRIIPTEQMKQLYEDINAVKKLYILKNATHAIRNPKHVILAMKVVTQWFNKTL